jgi:hypothetical protein
MKYLGQVGYGQQVEIRPGVWEDQITELTYYGDVLKNNRQSDGEEQINRDIKTGNLISIVADAFALEHFFDIRYVTWAGANWTVSHVEVHRPRLLLRLGGVYNGPTAPTPD